MNDLVKEIFVDKITDPAHAMRSEVRDESLFELASNIKANGLINPITVRPVEGGYEVVAGHRRFSACKINGMIKIPCVVRDLTDQETFAVMAAENLERKDVDVVDESRFIKEYLEQAKVDVKEAARQLRRSVQYVESRLAVAEMPDYLQECLKKGTIKLGAALALTQIENERIRYSWVLRAAEFGISVQQAEFQLHDYQANKSMYDGQIAEHADTGIVPEPKPIMFRCTIDGQEYDSRLVKYVPIYEGNLELLHSIISELNRDTAPTQTPA